MLAYILNHHHVLPAADHADILDVLASLEGDETGPDPDPLLVDLHLVVVLFSEVVLIPFELLEQQQAPALLHVDNRLDFLEDGVEFLEDLFEGEDVVGVLGVLLPRIMLLGGCFFLHGVGFVVVLLAVVVVLLAVSLPVVVVVVVLVHSMTD